MSTPTNPDAPEAKPPHYVIKRKIEPMYAEHFKARAKEEAAMDATPATGTDTPETDAARLAYSYVGSTEFARFEGNEIVPADFARRLEADRTALRAELAQYRKAGKWADEQLAALRGQVEEARELAARFNSQINLVADQRDDLHTQLAALKAERDTYARQLRALGKNPLPPSLTRPVSCSGDGSLSSDNA